MPMMCSKHGQYELAWGDSSCGKCIAEASAAYTCAKAYQDELEGRLGFGHVGAEYYYAVNATLDAYRALCWARGDYAPKASHHS